MPDPFRSDWLHPSPALAERLVCLGKIWGFLKYYHPAIAAGGVDWDAALLAFLPDYLTANSQAECNDLVGDWIDDLAPLPEIFTPAKSEDKVRLLPDLGWLANDTQFGATLAQKLLAIKYASRPLHHHYVEIADPIGNAVFKNEHAYA